MKNLQKLFLACAAALVVAVGGFDASAQPDDKWREARKRRQEDWRENRKREAEDWREARKRENEYERESRKRWRENERESWKQEKEYWKEQRKRDKEYRKHEKEYWKERRREEKDEWKDERDDDRRYRRESRRNRNDFPFMSRDVYVEPRREIYIDDARYDDGILDDRTRRPSVMVAPDYDDRVYGSGDAVNFNDLASEYISETAASSGAEMNWLEPIIGIFDGLFSGDGLSGDLFSALPQLVPGNDADTTDQKSLYRLASAAAAYEAQ